MDDTLACTSPHASLPRLHPMNEPLCFVSLVYRRAATEGARQELALRCCELLGAPLPPAARSSNAPGAGHAHFATASLAALGRTAALMRSRWQPDAQDPLSPAPTGKL